MCIYSRRNQNLSAQIRGQLIQTEDYAHSLLPLPLPIHSEAEFQLYPKSVCLYYHWIQSTEQQDIEEKVKFCILFYQGVCYFTDLAPARFSSTVTFPARQSKDQSQSLDFFLPLFVFLPLLLFYSPSAPPCFLPLFSSSIFSHSYSFFFSEIFF